MPSFPDQNVASASDEDLPLSTLRNFRVLFSAVKTHFSLIHQRCEIPGAQLWALHETDKHHGLTVGQLAHLLAVKPTTASNLIEKLATAGYLERQKSDRDQRKVLLQCTDQGRALLARAPASPEGLLPAALARLQADDLRELNRLLLLLLAECEMTDLSAAERPLADLYPPQEPGTS